MNNTVQEKLATSIGILLSEIDMPTGKTTSYLVSEFKKVVELRTQIAKSRGFLDYSQFIADNLLKDSTYSYQEITDFIKNNRHKIDKFENTQVINLLPELSVNFPDMVFQLVESEEKITLPKIKLVISPDHQSASYLRADDQFEIRIPEMVSKNQKISMLLHELGHVATYLKVGPVNNRLDDEKNAMAYEFIWTNQISSQFQASVINAYLPCLSRVEAELRIYSDHDYSLRYFNFLKDKKILMSPFVDLPVVYGLLSNLKLMGYT